MIDNNQTSENQQLTVNDYLHTVMPAMFTDWYPDVIIIGAGLYGLTIAQQAAEHDYNALIIEAREHIGGNCYSYVDSETGAVIHKYGAHIFHTSNPIVWHYVNRWSSFTNYEHHVFTVHNSEVYSLPINLGTINQFFHAHYTPSEARRLIIKQAGEYADVEPSNLNEQGIKLIGKPLYDAFIKNYTAKQWNVDPSELPASVITRLPVRYTYDNRYFQDTWEGIPTDGYTEWFTRMIDNPNIKVITNVDFLDSSQALSKANLLGRIPIVYTGPIDKWFDYKYGRLSYRTVFFKEHYYNENNHLGCAVMNYADADVPYTRSIEFKNFNPERDYMQSHDKTVVWDEYSKKAGENDEPCYPVRTKSDMKLYEQYARMIDNEPGVHIGGRLGSYKYYDMDDTILSALTDYENNIEPLIRMFTCEQ